jgi:hypothetical protein
MKNTWLMVILAIAAVLTFISFRKNPDADASGPDADFTPVPGTEPVPGSGDGKGTLYLTYTPQAMKLQVTNAAGRTIWTGFRPTGVYHFTPGIYKYRASAVNYLARSGKFTIAEGKDTFFNVDLERETKYEKGVVV